MKGRFRILKTGIRLQSAQAVDDVFLTCCILHNMILENDGLDEEWDEGFNWKGADGNHDDFTDSARHIFGRLRKDLHHSKLDMSGLGTSWRPRPEYSQYHVPIEIRPERHVGHNELKAVLINHFTYMRK
jgi:hypothetical protein